MCENSAGGGQQAESIVVPEEEEVPGRAAGEGRKPAGDHRGNGVYSLAHCSSSTTHTRNVQVNAIEFAAMERDVFERLKEGKDMLEEINREMSVDEVDRLMEDTREAIEYQNVWHCSRSLMNHCMTRATPRTPTYRDSSSFSFSKYPRHWRASSAARTKRMFYASWRL